MLTTESSNHKVLSSKETIVKRKYPDGPRGLPLLGNALDFRRAPVSFLLSLVDEDTKIGHFRVGPIHGFLLNDPADIHSVLIENANKYYKDRLTKTAGGKFAGKGLVLNDGAPHTRQRRLMQPA